MTPGARVAAAIEVLDNIVGGAPAEQQLTTWARKHRFAGSSDRAAIRDHVFDVLRRRRSSAALGGSDTGRGLMIGLFRGRGEDAADYFDGQGHSPPPLSGAELAVGQIPSEAVAVDCPPDLEEMLRRSLGAGFAEVMGLMRDRAPVFLRSNTHVTTRDHAITVLAGDGIVAVPHNLSPTALEVVENPRKVRRSRAFLEGLVEVQDAASQAVADMVPVTRGATVLDFCAGGGGKSLALAARGALVVAHDANSQRLADLPARALRSKLEDRVSIAEIITKKIETVLIDVPCSGSGAWRRNPDAKWRTTPEDVGRLSRLQGDILAEASRLVAPGGVLAYATCSVIDTENINQIKGFLKNNPGWILELSRSFSLNDGADGFFCALLREKQP